MKRTIAIILVVATIVTCCTCAYAATESNAFILSYSAGTYADGNGVVTVDFDIVGKGTLANLGVKSIYLYENGSAILYISYLSSSYSYIMGHNCNSYGTSVSFNGTAGRTYYAIITFYGGDGTSYDTETYQTGSVVAT